VLSIYIIAHFRLTVFIFGICYFLGRAVEIKLALPPAFESALIGYSIIVIIIIIIIGPDDGHAHRIGPLRNAARANY